MTTPAGITILGVDPGSRFTGYGVIRMTPQGQEMVEWGVLQLDAKESHTTRLKQIYDGLFSLIQRTRPDEVAIEMPVYGKNPQSMLKLGRAQAAAMLAALNAGLPVTEYTPKEVKRSVTGNGNAAKEQVHYMVCAMLDLQEQREDVSLDTSDAIAVALCHGHRAGKADKQTSYKDWASYVRQHPDRVSGTGSKK